MVAEGGEEEVHHGGAFGLFGYHRGHREAQRFYGKLFGLCLLVVSYVVACGGLRGSYRYILAIRRFTSDCEDGTRFECYEDFRWQIVSVLSLLAFRVDASCQRWMIKSKNKTEI
jgi:hypothetical protein